MNGGFLAQINDSDEISIPPVPVDPSEFRHRTSIDNQAGKTGAASKDATTASAQVSDGNGESRAHKKKRNSSSIKWLQDNTTEVKTQRNFPQCKKVE